MDRTWQSCSGRRSWAPGPAPTSPTPAGRSALSTLSSRTHTKSSMMSKQNEWAEKKVGLYDIRQCSRKLEGKLVIWICYWGWRRGSAVGMYYMNQISHGLIRGIAGVEQSPIGLKGCFTF